MAINIPEIDGVTRIIQREFVKPLRSPKTGFRLFAGKELKSGHWSAETHTWFETTDMSNVVVSMDLPPVQSDSASVAPKTLNVPLLTKDLVLGGRKAEQVRRAGLDPILVDGMANAMATEMERALLLGFPANSGGPVTGLLNDADSPAAVALGALSDAATVNGAISTLVANAIEDDMDGPYALVTSRSPGDIALFQEFISGTNVRIGDNLPGSLPGSMGGIQAILPSKHVSANTMFLVDLSEGNYHAISPEDEGSLRFGLGTVTTGEVARSSLLTDADPIMLSRTWRNLNAIVPRIVRPNAIQEGTFTVA